MVNADRATDSAIAAAPAHIAMSGSGALADFVIAARYVVDVPTAADVDDPESQNR